MHFGRGRAGERTDDAVGADLANAMVPRIGDVQAAIGRVSDAFRPRELCHARGTTVARIAFLAGTRDVKNPPPPGRVVINHNRDIGLMRNDRMVVLSLGRKVEFYRGNPKTTEMIRLDRPDDSDLEPEKDAIALYQTADELYMQRKYRVEQPTSTK